MSLKFFFLRVVRATDHATETNRAAAAPAAAYEPAEATVADARAREPDPAWRRACETVP